MTIESAILARSYLPKDGTYSMVDHILANQMNVVGTQVGLSISVDNTPIKIVENKANIKVKESIIRVKIDVTTDNVVVENSAINVRIK